MADDIAISAGVGTTVATDDVAGRHFQRIKLHTGEDGSAEPLGDTDKGTARALWVDNRSVTPRKQVSSAGLTTAATAYVANDQLGTILEFTNAVRDSGGSGQIVSATLLDKAKIVGAVDLYLFDRSVTLAADNAVADQSDADMMFCLGVLRFPAPLTATSNGISTIETSGLGIACNATSLFGALVTRSGHTFFGAVGDLVVSLLIAQD